MNSLTISLTQSWKKYVLAMLPAAAIGIGLAVSTAEASSDRFVSDLHTPEEIVAKWEQYKPTFTGDPFVEKPSVQPPYAPGKLKEDYVQDGVNMANFVRYLTGLPDDLVQDPALNEQAQYGAVVLAATGVMSHYPSKLQDMPEGFFQFGAKSTSSSNLVVGLKEADRIVLNYMRDSDFSNIDRVGHRRWILNPPLKKVGFGLATSQVGMSYSSMQVFDKSGQGWSSAPMIAWPSPGAFPTVAWQGGDAWSVTLNPLQYEAPQLDQVQVTLKRTSDDRTWIFDQSDKVTPNASLDYFNIDSSNTGAGPSIIFRPSYDGTSSDLDVYEVKIAGIRTLAGEPATISYKVSLFDIPAPSDAADYFAEWRKPRPAPSRTPITFDSEIVEASVRQILGIMEGDITEADLARISFLNINYSNGDTALDERLLPKMTGLYSLNIQNPGESGVIAAAKMKRLIELEVHANEKLIRNLASQATFKQLKSLTLVGNVSGETLKSLLVKLPNLQSLRVESNRLTDLSFIPPSTLARLEYLDVTSGGLRDVTALNQPNRLRSLLLLGGGVPVRDVRPIYSLTGLQWLELNFMGITDADVVHIAKMRELKGISLRKGQITNLTPLLSLTKLTYLDLFGNRIRNITGIQRLSALRTIDLSNNGIYDIAPIMNGNFDIYQLDVSGNFLDLSGSSKEKLWLEELAEKVVYNESNGMTFSSQSRFDSQLQAEIWSYTLANRPGNLLEDTLLMVKGESIPAKLIVTNTDFSSETLDKDGKWTSSDPEVVTIKNGQITAKSGGYTSVTVKKGTVERKFYINVLDRPDARYYHSKLNDLMEKQLEWRLVLQLDSKYAIRNEKLTDDGGTPFVDKATSTTMIPAQFVSQQIEARFAWNAKTKTATITSWDDSASIEVKAGEKRMKVNGTYVALPASAQMVNGVLYMPLREFCETMDKQVTVYKGTIFIGPYAMDKETELLSALNQILTSK